MLSARGRHASRRGLCHRFHPVNALCIVIGTEGCPPRKTLPRTPEKIRQGWAFQKRMATSAPEMATRRVMRCLSRKLFITLINRPFRTFPGSVFSGMSFILLALPSRAHQCSHNTGRPPNHGTTTASTFHDSDFHVFFSRPPTQRAKSSTDIKHSHPTSISTILVQ